MYHNAQDVEYIQETELPYQRIGNISSGCCMMNEYEKNKLNHNRIMSKTPHRFRMKRRYGMIDK